VHLYNKNYGTIIENVLLRGTAVFSWYYTHYIEKKQCVVAKTNEAIDKQ